MTRKDEEYFAVRETNDRRETGIHSRPFEAMNEKECKVYCERLNLHS